MARYDRDYDRRRDRDFWDRAGDEVRSWFGDEEAERRREMDERYNRDYDRGRAYGRMGSERGDYGDRYREGRYYGPDYSRYERGYEGTRYGREGEWVLPRVQGGRGRYDYDRDRDYGYGQSEREERWSEPQSFRSGERGAEYGRTRDYGYSGYAGRMGGMENLVEGTSGRVSYDDPYWRRTGQQGPHAGKGPRGYEPSIDRIKEAVCERLTHHGEIDASDIDVSVENGEVTLTGMVDSRRAKRLAEDVAESVASVRDVHNRLTVRQRETGTMGGTSTSSGTTMGTGSGTMGGTSAGTISGTTSGTNMGGTRTKTSGTS